MTKNIYYSVQNGGDGSAYPQFFDNEKLADFDQDHLDEGWGESCTGQVTIHGDNIVVENITTKYSYLYEKYIDGYNPSEDEIKEFLIEFFDNEKLPEYTVNKIDSTWIGIYYKNQLVGRELIESHTIERISNKIENELEKFKSFLNE